MFPHPLSYYRAGVQLRSMALDPNHVKDIAAAEGYQQIQYDD